MTNIEKLMAFGQPALVAKELAQIDLRNGLTATGSVISQALELVADVSRIDTSTSATADCVKLRDFASSPKGFERIQYVVNRSAAQIRVFCPTGGTMNNTSNGSVTLTSGSHGIFACVSDTANDYVKL